MIRVLLVEDDGSIAEIIRYYLKQSGEYEVTVAPDASAALTKAQAEAFDVILLDVMLPDTDGVELCTHFREKLYCPIIFISCIDDEETIIRALRMGGDDYLVKPFNCEMLQARMEANLRRVRMEQRHEVPERIVFARFCVDTKKHSVEKDGKRKDLSPIEYNLLQFFISHPETNFTLSALYEKIWGRPSLGDVRTVMVHIHNLRKKIEDDPNNPEYLCSIRGKGYVFHAAGGQEGPSRQLL